MKTLIAVFGLALALDLEAQGEIPVHICTVISAITKSYKMREVQAVSKTYGKIDAVVCHSDLLVEKFNIYKKEYICQQDFRVTIFTDEEVFYEDIKKAIQIDEATKKGKKVFVRFSVVEFPVGKDTFRRNIVFTNTIQIRLKE